MILTHFKWRKLISEDLCDIRSLKANSKAFSNLVIATVILSINVIGKNFFNDISGNV